MKQLINNLKGDKGIWSFVALLALFSFMPVLVRAVIWPTLVREMGIH